ncbi:TetR/AcrR family transcriptional regulator [Streptosporangium sp. NPDC049046]|uniref:TetR/AcrR family transcriptional regulator n=1 Tax=unclassified Streptosporangium TaxID=2632669 RepID=UPI00343961FA
MAEIRPRGRGAAVLRRTVTDTILAAAVAELAETGYAGMSMGAVARRAGTGKAALYRRWSSKEEMVVDLIDVVASRQVPVGGAGDLNGDVRAYVRAVADTLSDPAVMCIVLDLTAEAARNPELAEAFDTAIRQPRRAACERLLRSAMERGQLPADLDLDLALDLLVGLTQWRVLNTGRTVDDSCVETTSKLIIQALPLCVGVGDGRGVPG